MRIEIITGKNIKKHFGLIPAVSLNMTQMKKIIADVFGGMPCPVIAGVKSETGINVFVGADFLVSLTIFMANSLPTEDGRTFRDLTPEETELFTELQIPVTVYNSLTSSQMDDIKNYFAQTTIVEKQEKVSEPPKNSKEVVVSENSLLDKFKAHKFFESTALTEVSDEVVLTMMLLSDGTLSDVSKKTLDEYLATGNLVDISKQLDFMNKAFPEKEAFLKKIHLPMITFMASTYQDKKTPAQFAKAIKGFYENPTVVYKKACDSGTASKSNVTKRIEELKTYVAQNI